MRRVLAFPLVRLVLIVLLFGIIITPIFLASHRRPGIGLEIAMYWVIAAVLAFSMIVVERLAARKPPAAIGFNPRHAARDLALGVVLGAALFSIVILELALAGFYRVAGFHLSPDLAVAALLLIPGAIVEKLLFRGVIFRLTQEWAGTWIALAVSAVIFGLVHGSNPGATWVSTVAIALEAGILLGAAFVVTKNLWFPIGLHFAWNFFEGPVFGTQVSGHSFLTSALSARLSGPAVFTGGSFGPEAGVAAIVTCLAAAIVLLVVAKRRSLILSPSWRKPRVALSETTS